MENKRHPHYGPCDQFDDGDCAECLNEIERLRGALGFYACPQRVGNEWGGPCDGFEDPDSLPPERHHVGKGLCADSPFGFTAREALKGGA